MLVMMTVMTVILSLLQGTTGGEKKKREFLTLRAFL